MTSSVYEIGMAVLVVLAAVLVLVWLIHKRVARSEWRMVSMLQRVGVDMEIMTRDREAAVIQKARRRCRACQVEDVCEQWLAGQFEGENHFCPNARTFTALARESSAAF